MSKSEATAKVEDRGDAYEPVAGEVVQETDRAPESGSPAPATAVDAAKREFKSLPRQEFITHPAGVHLIHDMERGVYTLRFNPDMPKDEFKGFLNEQLSPILLDQRQLKDGPTVRFHEQPDGSYEMRYRFRERDEKGNHVIGEDGKKKWVNYHAQVSVIANRVADRAGRLLAEKLGLSKSAEIPF